MADNKKYLHNLDVVNNKVMNLLLNPLTTSQRTTVGSTLGVNEEGYVCFDTTLNQQYFWDGTQWIVVGGGGSGSGTVTSIATSSPLTGGTITTSGTIGITQSSGSANGYLSSTDWTTFNSKQNTITLTTTGISGAATFASNVLNIPQYQSVLTNPVTGTGTATRVAFWDTGSSISSDADLYWDNTLKRLGIGTATPAYKLDVNGTGRFVNDLYADEDFIVNNYFAINTTATAFPIPNGTLGIWRRKGNGFGTYFLEDEQGAAKDKWAFVKRQGYGGTREWYQTNSSIVNINYGWQSPNSSNYQGATLLIDPTINITDVTHTGTILRGIYYNPTLTAIVNTTHIAYQNTSGDIIHGNLATGGAAQMVTADSNGKLGIQTIPSGGGGTVTSVGLTMPTAFNVASSPITTSGTIAVTGAGTVSQYVRGDGTLANFPNSTGGGSSVNYYLNGSISQGTFGGDTYYQLSKTPVFGAGTNFTRTNGAGNGYIASFITDVADPSQLNIPGGNWNVEFYFQSSASGGTPSFYAELYKVSATNVFTLIASDASNPEGITNGTTVDQYFTSIPVPQTTLLITDRLAIRVFVNTGGRTITLHTENSNLSEVLTTFTTGLTALNGLTEQVQNFATGTSGTDFAISSSTATHTFNLPTASATNRGALSTSDWTTFNGKQNSRSVNVVSVDTTVGNTAGTDYVYLVSGTTTITLPTAVGNTNRYTIKRSGTGVISIATTSSQTIDGSASPITINVQYVSIDLISNGTDWEII